MKNIGKKKWIYVGIAVVVIAAVIAIVRILDAVNGGESVGKTNGETGSVTDTVKIDETVETSETIKTTEEKVYTPTFMYFVSKSDADYNQAMSVVAELEEEYGDKVKFDIVDIDENPEAKTNFAMVDGNTPFLIMLNTKNDIIAFEFKCSDKEKLSADIENAFK